jgi:hypothetical protein
MAPCTNIATNFPRIWAAAYILTPTNSIRTLYSPPEYYANHLVLRGTQSCSDFGLRRNVFSGTPARFSSYVVSRAVA